MPSPHIPHSQTHYQQFPLNLPSKMQEPALWEETHQGVSCHYKTRHTISHSTLSIGSWFYHDISKYWGCLSENDTHKIIWNHHLLCKWVDKRSREGRRKSEKKWKKNRRDLRLGVDRCVIRNERKQTEGNGDEPIQSIHCT